MLTLLFVYVRYNALYIKLFALYNNIFLWRLVKPKTGLKPVFNNRKPVCQKTGFNIPTCVYFILLVMQPLSFGLVYWSTDLEAEVFIDLTVRLNFLGCLFVLCWASSKTLASFPPFLSLVNMQFTFLFWFACLTEWLRGWGSNPYQVRTSCWDFLPPAPVVNSAITSALTLHCW